MAHGSNEYIGKELAKVKRDVKNLQKGRLGNASMHGGALPYYDDEGNLRAIFGDQGDGSWGAGVVSSPPQPTPTAPLVSQIDQFGMVQAGWDGDIVLGRVPQVHGRVDVLSAFSPDGSEPAVSDYQVVSSIWEREGGTTTIVCPQPGVWFVRLQMVGADERTKGAMSDPATVDIEGLVDTDAIEAELDAARERLAEAEAEARQALDEVGAVRDEWAVEYPRLQQEIAEAQDAVADAEVRLGQAEQSITDSQAGLENLRDVRLPALELTLDGVESAVADYDQRIQAAQDGADSARQTAETLRDDTLPTLQGELSDLTENRLPAVEGTLDQTRLGMENLRDIRLPELQDTLNSGLSDANQWRDVGAISASSLRVGSWDNLILDPRFEDPNWWANGYHATRVGDTTRNGVTYRRWRANRSALTLNLVTPRWVAVPGAEYSLNFTYQIGGDLNGSANDYFVWARFFDRNNQFIAGSTPLRETEWSASFQWDQVAYSFTVPEGVEGVEFFEINWRFRSMSRDLIDIANPVLRQRVDSNLLVDGAVSARHIIAEEVAGAVAQFLHIEADQIDTQGLAAYLATIIELDAGQITSGKINTSRLDAEEVAGAVANFLALDALEINVEQLAGEIANIIEVTAESIASGSISTRHMAIADTENLFPQQAVEDLAANGDNTAPWVRVRGNTNRWHTVTGQGRGMRSIRINDGTASHARTTLEYAPGSNLGIQMSPGDAFRLTFYGWAGGSGAAPRISLLTRNAAGSFVGRPATATAVSGWNEYELEVHNTDSEVRFLRVEFDVPAGVAMRGHWQDFKLRRMTGGELIVDGSISARHIIAEEIAAAVGEFLELHADQITAGQIDTSLLNVDDLAARIATVIELNASRITTGQLGAARINVADLYSNTAFINNLRAAVVTALQLTAERGFIGGALLADNTIDVAKLNVTEQMTAELAQFLVVNAGQIAANAIDGMTIQGGQIIGGEFRTRAGDLYTGAGAGVMNSQFLRGIGEGGQVNTEVNFSDGRLFARDLQIAGNGALTGSLRFGTSSAVGQGRLAADGDRMRIQGVMPADSGAGQDTFLYGTTPPATIDLSGGASPRVVVVYAEPRPNFQSAPFLQTSPYGMGGPQNRSANVVSSSTYYPTRSGFEVISRCVGAGANSTDQYSIRYNSLWRAGADAAG